MEKMISGPNEKLLPNPAYRKKLMEGMITSGDKEKPGYLKPRQAKEATDNLVEKRKIEEYEKREAYDLNSGQ